MQNALYYEGLSLSDPETYRKIAVDNNMDPNAVVEHWKHPPGTTAAHEDFTKVRNLGVNSFSTLLLRNGNEPISPA